MLVTQYRDASPVGVALGPPSPTKPCDRSHHGDGTPAPEPRLRLVDPESADSPDVSTGMTAMSPPSSPD
jgi:hypothetical protein